MTGDRSWSFPGFGDGCGVGEVGPSPAPLSNAMGDLWPRAECRPAGLYRPPMDWSEDRSERQARLGLDPGLAPGRKVAPEGGQDALARRAWPADPTEGRSSWMVVRKPLRRLTSAEATGFISRSTRLRPTRMLPSAGTAWILGAPCVSLEARWIRAILWDSRSALGGRFPAAPRCISSRSGPVRPAPSPPSRPACRTRPATVAAQGSTSRRPSPRRRARSGPAPGSAS